MTCTASGAPLSTLAPSVQRTLDAFAAGPLRSPNDLREAVDAHRRAAQEAANRDGHVDLHLAGVLATACHALLDLWPQREEADRRLIQAACLYYVDQDDDESDFSSVMGFDDDSEVIAHVANLLGCPDLHVS